MAMDANYDRMFPSTARVSNVLDEDNFLLSLVPRHEFVYGNPASIPDEVLELPLPLATKWVIMNTPISFIEAAQFKDHIHTGPGVSIPTHIEHQLSIGMKYLFHQPRRTELITDAWRDFDRRIRWKVHFMLMNEDSFYDPDYDVAVRSKKDPPVVPWHLHLALRKGRSFVHKTVTRIPDDGSTDTTFQPLGPRLKEVKQFLFDNNYVVTATDKNLGIAVSERTWIISKSRDCLADENAYKKVSKAQAKEILDRKCVEMRALSSIAEQFDEKYGSLSAFLKHKVTAEGDDHHIPKFYGIPKIHKQPVKFRPILPCHSAIQNPAAKFCSKVLKPLVNAAPTVIRGTKDLAIKLSQLQLPPWREIFIVTGDVVGYYPNIPLRKCLDRVFEMYLEYYWNDADLADNIEELELFRRCLETGNTELLTQFDGQIHQQLMGLAMGVADSPDLANLYGWYCERRDKVLENPRIAFYGRYIDDCAAIVFASSEAEALDAVRTAVKIDDCEITWEVGKFLPFLDMMLYVDRDNSLQHMPYKKARNHQERIPWISAHPYDVKRGTFYGEMSRLATLSSKKEHYLAALESLVALYVKRGYPIGIVQAWRKEKQRERWDNRLRVEKWDKPDVLVLKSSFNTAWNYFSAKELGNTMFDYLRIWTEKAKRRDYSFEYPPRPSGYPLVQMATVTKGLFLSVDDRGQEYRVPDFEAMGISNRKVIVSRKRTFNLYDTVNLWKKIVLEQLDERESTADAIRPIDETHLLLDPLEGYRRLRSGRLIAESNDEEPQRRSPSPVFTGNPTDDDVLSTLFRVGLR